jgi:hypothetical protein
MATIPHWTEANQKWAKNEVLPEWVMTFRDPIILNAWHAMLRAPKPERVSHLAALIRERHPRMHALYGPFLEAELTALASAALGNPDALNTPGFLQQFTPDNPIRRTPDGTWDIPPTLVEDRHFDQLRNYIRSLRPPRPTGRSKKPPSDHPPPPHKQARSRVIGSCLRTGSRKNTLDRHLATAFP